MANLTKALPSATSHGRATIFSVVDALTRHSGKMNFAGDRTALDHKISQLLALAA